MPVPYLGFGPKDSSVKLNSMLLRTMLVALAASVLVSGCAYRKMDPPADSDKAGGGGVDNSCYLATAANMLAGAGYGDGATLQARAADIYGDLTAQFGVANTGWTDVALSWWLGSANNTWPGNPYTVVAVLGNKSPKNPWANANGAMDIGNDLRDCCFVGLSISWPTAGASIGSGGHAITAWGDNLTDNTLTLNPTEVAVSDSDSDTGGDEQVYAYDAYTSPNPGGPNEGNGWYFDYSNNHPYIKHIITLCPTDDPTDFTLTQKVTGSYTLPQNGEMAATDLHYVVSTDVEILTYRTWIDWDTENSPVITESGDPRDTITVDWDLSDNPVPPGTDVTISTEFVLPRWNAMTYSDVHWTYPGDGKTIERGPAFERIAWNVETPALRSAERLPNNVTGGFVVGAFDLIVPDSSGGDMVLPYRFQHEYSYSQAPEVHLVRLTGRPGVLVRNLRLGNSWNYLEPGQLQKFDDWLTVFDQVHQLGDEPFEFKLDWTGKVPYPEGENIYEAIPDIDEKSR